MSKSKNLYILGYSGHAYVVIDVAVANNFLVNGYFDFEEHAENPYHIPYLGNEKKEDVSKIIGKNIAFPAVGSNAIRKKLFDFLIKNGCEQTFLVDKSAYVSVNAKLGDSTLVAPKAVVNSGSIIGDACIINTGAIVEHECKIGDFTHVAPGAVLAGNVVVGTNAFVGANSVVKQGISIGKNTIIGAGSVVLRDVPEGETWVGNPANILR